MQNIATKTTGDSLTAAEWNQVPDELENGIQDTGQTLSGANLHQISIAMAIYSAGGAFYTESGAANAYVVSTVGAKRAPVAYFDGMAISFRAGNTNTAASTVNVAALGVKTIQNDGAAVVAGDIRDDNITTAVYNSGTGFFDLTSVPKAGSVVQFAEFYDGDFNSGTTVFVADDTIPQITEGNLFLTMPSFTPTKATNKIRIEALLVMAHSAVSNPGMSAAIFKDSNANAISAGGSAKAQVAEGICEVVVTAVIIPGAITPIVFTVRGGATVAGTASLNGNVGGRFFGGVYTSSITITEIEV